MGSDTYSQNLKNINRYLTKFENIPKKIEGNLISEWFNVGENIFEEFYELGTSLQWNFSEIKTEQPDIVHIVSQISKNKDWLQTFITIYPGLRVDLEGVTPAVDVCRVRSGIEFLLRGFVNINTNFDKVISDLKEFGELEEFDDCLRVWKECHRPNFFPGDQRMEIPESHWWWF